MPKETQPKNVRYDVWKQYNGEQMNGLCFCCKSKLHYNNFNCGHIISNKYGGKAEINNLRPICSMCNGSMGTMNMYDFMKDKGFNIPIDAYDFKELTDQMLQIMCLWSGVVFDLNDKRRVYKQLSKKRYSDHVYNYINSSSKYLVSCGIPKCVECKFTHNNDTLKCECGVHWYYTDEPMSESMACKVCQKQCFQYMKNGFRREVTQNIPRPNPTEKNVDDNVILIRNQDDINKIPYKIINTKIVSCRINKKSVERLKYSSILVELLAQCRHVTRNTKYVNMTKEKQIDKGYKFYNELGLSIRYACAEKTLYEILNQCVVNNIRLKIKIEVDGNEICIAT